MYDYGNPHGNSKSRANMKSPQTHNLEDAKAYKKKYEQARQAFNEQKKMNEALESKLQQMQELIDKQNRELQKKQQINEVLLDRIKCLKNQLSDMQSKKSSEDTSYQQKNNAKSSKSNTSNQDCSIKSQPVVGGYFGSIFK